MRLPSADIVQTDTNSGKSYLHRVAALKLHPQGFIHWADDGIVRSYAPDESVVDAVRLNNTELIHHFSTQSNFHEEMNAHMLEIYEGKSGHDVSEEHLFDPPDMIRPHPSHFGDSLQSRNELLAIKEELLDKRAYPACHGKPCYSSDWCRLNGCISCQTVDEYLNLPRSRLCFGHQLPDPIVPIIGSCLSGLGCLKKTLEIADEDEAA